MFITNNLYFPPPFHYSNIKRYVYYRCHHQHHDG